MFVVFGRVYYGLGSVDKLIIGSERFKVCKVRCKDSMFVIFWFDQTLLAYYTGVIWTKPDIV